MNHFRIIIIIIVHHGPLTDDPKSIPAWAGPITRLCTQTYLSVIAAGYWRWLKVKEVKKLNGFRWLCPVYPLSIQSFQPVFCFLLWQHSTLSSEYLNTFGRVRQIASEAKIQITPAIELEWCTWCRTQTTSPKCWPKLFPLTEPDASCREIAKGSRIKSNIVMQFLLNKIFWTWKSLFFPSLESSSNNLILSS